MNFTAEQLVLIIGAVFAGITLIINTLKTHSTSATLAANTAKLDSTALELQKNTQATEMTAGQVQQIEIKINGRMSEFLEAVRKSARLEGEADARTTRLQGEADALTRQAPLSGPDVLPAPKPVPAPNLPQER
jgi:hypothetical protein